MRQESQGGGRRDRGSVEETNFLGKLRLDVLFFDQHEILLLPSFFKLESIISSASTIRTSW